MPDSTHEARLRAFLQHLLGGDLPPGQPLAGGGSTRQYFRYPNPREPGAGVIGVAGRDAAEMHRFLRYTHYFAAQGVPVPRVLGADEAGGLYAMEDLGPNTLAEQLKVWQAQGAGATARAALEQAVRWLPRLQVLGSALLRDAAATSTPGPSPAIGVMDGAAFLRDVDFFVHWYVEHRAPRLRPAATVRADLAQLARVLDALPRDLFCYRDFQARNIMWPGDARGVVFLDYQDALWGPGAYDLASLLFSPDSHLDGAGREHLMGVYVEAAQAAGLDTGPEALRHALYPIVLLRRMQALGAYVRISKELGKTAYLDKIPAALETLRAMQAQGQFTFGLPALEAWLADLLTP